MLTVPAAPAQRQRPQVRPEFLAMAQAIQLQLAQQQAKPNGPAPSDSLPSAS